MAGEMRIVAIAAALATLLFAGVSASTSSHSKGTSEEWLSWTSEQKGVYVDAYLSGYVSGKTDACVAAAFTSWVCESPLTGPGGGGFMLVHEAESGRTVVVDVGFQQFPGYGVCHSTWARV